MTVTQIKISKNIAYIAEDLTFLVESCFTNKSKEKVKILELITQREFKKIFKCTILVKNKSFSKEGSDKWLLWNRTFNIISF